MYDYSISRSGMTNFELMKTTMMSMTMRPNAIIAEPPIDIAPPSAVYSEMMIARPNAAPKVDAILNIADATPTFSGGVVETAVSSAGVANNPMPMPNNAKPIRQLMIYAVSPRNVSDSSTTPTASIIGDMTIARLAPYLLILFSPTRIVNSISTTYGNVTRPASNGVNSSSDCV